MPCPGDPGPRPSFIPLGKSARVVMKYAAMGQTIENVFYFTRDSAYGVAELENLALAAEASWITNMQPALPGSCTLVDITATAVDVQNGQQYIAPVNSAGTSGTAAFQDPGATFAVKFGTGQSGRSYRGRAYWPLLITTGITDGALSIAQAGVYVGAYSDFFSDIFADTADIHVVASFQNDCEWRTNGVATPVRSYTYADLNLDSQRRRLPGRGI